MRRSACGSAGRAPRKPRRLPRERRLRGQRQRPRFRLWRSRMHPCGGGVSFVMGTYPYGADSKYRLAQMARLTDLIRHLDELLSPGEFADMGPNGLQVPGRDEV